MDDIIQSPQNEEVTVHNCIDEAGECDENSVNVCCKLQLSQSGESLSSKKVTETSSKLLAPTKSFSSKTRSMLTQNNKKLPAHTTAGNLTVPISPKFSTVHHSSSLTSAKTTAELEYCAAEQKRKDELIRIAKARKAFDRIKVTSGRPAKTVVRSTKELTIPNTPFSHMTNRLGSRQYSTTATVATEQAPTRMNSGEIKTVTVPEPFHLATENRFKSVAPPAVPTAGELIQQFQKDPRSHNVPVAVCQQLTDPHAPAFHTTNRPTTVLSTAEIEDNEMKHFAETSFKAKAVEKFALGLSKVETRPTTIPEPFNLQLSQAPISASSESDLLVKNGDTAAFKALPLPAPRSPKLYQPGQSTVQVTRAVSPKMNGAARASSAPARRQKLPVGEQQNARMKELAEENRRLVQSGVAKSRPSLSGKPTVPVGFQFESDKRGEIYQQQMKQQHMLEEQVKKKANRIIAKPAPTSDKPFEAAPSTKTLTSPTGFDLNSVARHEEAKDKFDKAVVASQNDAVVAANAFHAQQLPKSTFQTVFKIEPVVNRPPLKTMNLNLATNSRQEKRKEFDKKAAENRQQLEDNKKKLVLQQEEQEKEEIKAARRSSVAEGGFCFKAGTVVASAAVKNAAAINSGQKKALTKPVSPYLRTKERATLTLDVASTDLGNNLNVKDEAPFGQVFAELDAMIASSQ